MPNVKRALVTGAEGFIGRRLVKFLLSRGWQVTAGYRVHKADSSESSKRLNSVPLDLTDPEQVFERLRMERPTHLFHLAAESLPVASWIDPVRVFQSNVLGSLHLFEAIRCLPKPPLIVSACSSAEYGPVPRAKVPLSENYPLRPVNPYGLSKVCLEFLSTEYAKRHRIPAVTLRLFNTTGPAKVGDAPSDFVRQLIEIKRKARPAVVEVGNLSSQRAFLHVDDAVRAFYLAAVRAKRGEVYNVCAARPIAMRALLRLIIRLSGVKTQVRVAKHLFRPVDEPIIWGNSAKFRKSTGWRPAISLERILGEMIEYWDRRYDEDSTRGDE